MTSLNYNESSRHIFAMKGKKLTTVNLHLLILFLGALLIITAMLPITTGAQTSKQANDSADWIGNYYFSEMAQASKRRNRQDVVPSASYEIMVEEKQNNLTASFAANGVQLFEAYDCSVIIDGDKIEFYFLRLASAEVQNFRRFKKGDLLFRLSRIKVGKTIKYLFQPINYKIVRITPANQKTSVYFDKSEVVLSSLSTTGNKINLLANH